MKKILIIGAGGHGKVIKEIAEDVGYQKIDFIDDNNLKAIGKISDLEKFLEYQEAFVGIGNNRLRAKLIEKAQSIGFKIPVLIHPTAYVSKTAIIEKGTVIEPKAIINTEVRIAQGCIISVGAIVDHNVELEECVHINAGAIVKAGGRVSKYEKLEAGEVRLGYPSAIVATANSYDEFAKEEKEKTGKDVSFF